MHSSSASMRALPPHLTAPYESVSPVFALPPMWRIPRKSRTNCTCCPARCLVSKSAGFAVPATLANFTSPSWANCWTYNCPTRMWCSFPLPFRAITPRAVLLSTYTLPMDASPVRSPKPKPSASCTMPMSSAATLTAAPSSASAELRVTRFWVTEKLRKQCDPRIKMPPVVDRAVLRQPAQSESE